MISELVWCTCFCHIFGTKNNLDHRSLMIIWSKNRCSNQCTYCTCHQFVLWQFLFLDFMRYALVAKIPVGSKSHRRLPSVQCNVRWNGAPPGGETGSFEMWNGERLIAMGERYPGTNIFHLIGKEKHRLKSAFFGWDMLVPRRVDSMAYRYII